MKGLDVSEYGPVQVGLHSIVESGVVLGHPTPEQLQAAKQGMGELGTVEEFYSIAATSPTTIGQGSILRSGCVIYSGVEIGDDFDCGHHVVIREGARIGNRVFIKPFTYIGRDVTVGDCCRLGGSICDGSVIGSGSSMFGTLTHRYKSGYIAAREAAPVLGEAVIVGRGATVIGGCFIGSKAIIGAGAVVNFDVDEAAVIVGPKGRTVTTKLEP